MKFFLAILLICVEAIACEVRLPHNILVLNGSPDYSEDIYQSTACTKATMDEVHNTIRTLDGRIAAFQLEEILKTRGQNVDIGPRSILIQQIKTLIREQMHMPQGVQIKDSRGLNVPSMMALSNGDRVLVACDSCLYGTQQPIRFTIEKFDGSTSTHFASVDFGKMVRAYQIMRPLAAFSDLSLGDVLTEVYVDAVPHTELITDIDTLKFYKTNKPLRTGDLLKRSDLNALNLVKAGLKTEVILENNMIRIKTEAISRGNGSLGEFVEVFHPQKNKKYQGKVIDINKVLVEL